TASVESRREVRLSNSRFPATARSRKALQVAPTVTSGLLRRPASAWAELLGRVLLLSLLFRQAAILKGSRTGQMAPSGSPSLAPAKSVELRCPSRILLCTGSPRGSGSSSALTGN